jgi:hypothetical protein
VSLVAAAFIVVTYLRKAPVLADDTAPLVRFGPAFVSVAMMAVALLGIKRRVPDRMATQAIDAYWSDQQVGTRVALVWFLLEGAGTLAGVGYLLTGESVSALAMIVAISFYWWCRPALFLNE